MTVNIIQIQNLPLTVPERPADIKALSVNKSSIIVAWKPPLHNNGIIIKYNVYIRNNSDTSQVTVIVRFLKITV